MLEDRFAEGDPVPTRYRSDDGGDSIRFAVAVEVYGGYGGKRHVYPEERVEDVSSLFVGDRGVQFSDEVKLYTVPHDDLR